MIKDRKVTFSKIINFIIPLYILSLYILTYNEGLNIISNIIAGLLILLIWVESLARMKKIKFDKFFILYFTFILFTLFSIFVAKDFNLAFGKNITLLLLFTLMLSMANYLDSFNKLLILIKSFAYSGVVASIFILTSSDFSSIERFGELLGNVNAIGLIVAISTIFLVYLFLTSNIRTKKIILFLFIIQNSIVVIITGSRKSFVFLIMGILLVIYGYSIKKRGFKIKELLTAFLVVVILSYLIMNIPLFYQILGYRMEDLFDGVFGDGTVEGSFNTRTEMAKVGWNLFKQNPIFGSGIDNFRFISGFDTYSHNNFIELLVSVGIFGTLAFYISYLYVFYRILKYSKLDYVLSFTFISILLGYILLDIGLVYYDSKHISIILAAMSCIPQILSYKNKEMNHQLTMKKEVTFNETCDPWNKRKNNF